MFKDFGSFLFESTDSEERQKEKDQAEKLKKAKAAAADAKSKLDSTENDKEASDEDRAEAKLIYVKNTAIVTQLEADAKLKALKDSVKEDVNESFADTIKDLFKRTPVETKLLKSLDIFTDELLSPGQGKYDFVIKRAKEFGMDIDQDQAFKILQKRLAMEIEDLEESVDGSKVVKSNPMNEGVLVIAAGVILGLMTPNILKENSKLDDGEDNQVSVIEWLEERIHPWSSFIIVPLFAFANTGVVITNDSINDAINSSIAWGIFAGLVIGKPIGVLASVFIARKINLGQYAQRAKSVDILATGSAAGIGFTVAIFIANLAFSDPATQDLAIFAVIIASLVSAVLSVLLFKLVSKKR